MQRCVSMAAGFRSVFSFVASRPIVNVVVMESAALVNPFEHRPVLLVLRLFIESQGLDLFQVEREFQGETMAKVLLECVPFLLTDQSIFLVFSGLYVLPRQGTPEQIEQNVTDRFHVVPSRLFRCQVGVDTAVPGSAQHGFTGSVNR